MEKKLQRSIFITVYAVACLVILLACNNSSGQIQTPYTLHTKCLKGHVKTVKTFSISLIDYTLDSFDVNGYLLQRATFASTTKADLPEIEEYIRDRGQLTDTSYHLENMEMYMYDNEHRLLKIIYRSVADTDSSVDTWTYDQAGRLTGELHYDHQPEYWTCRRTFENNNSGSRISEKIEWYGVDTGDRALKHMTLAYKYNAQNKLAEIATNSDEVVLPPPYPDRYNTLYFPQFAWNLIYAPIEKIKYGPKNRYAVKYHYSRVGKLFEKVTCHFDKNGNITSMHNWGIYIDIAVGASVTCCGSVPEKEPVKEPETSKETYRYRFRYPRYDQHHNWLVKREQAPAIDYDYVREISYY
jgi:YD repeat-containing protein